MQLQAQPAPPAQVLALQAQVQQLTATQQAAFAQVQQLTAAQQAAVEQLAQVPALEAQIAQLNEVQQTAHFLAHFYSLAAY